MLFINSRPLCAITQESAERNNKKSGAVVRSGVFACMCWSHMMTGLTGGSLARFSGARKQMEPESRNRCQISLLCG